MTEEILSQGPGYVILATDELGTMTHYGPKVRADGTVNHGFIDLRDRPDLVDQIPEASKSEGLAEVLRVANAKGSPFLTIGCECHEFALEQPRYDGTTIHVGGFVDVTFRDSERASDRAALISLANWTIGGTAGPSNGEAIAFEFVIEPLKSFFGRDDCYGVMMKPHGYGQTSEEAWRSFNVAAMAMAQSLSRGNQSLSTD